MRTTTTQQTEHAALEAALSAYRAQLEFGSPQRTALDLATIVFQQRYPRVSTTDARIRIAETLDICVS